MKTARLSIIFVIATITTGVSATALRGQVSSPTPMTLSIERGPAWTRLRTAMPAIMAGGGRITEFPSWNVAAAIEGPGQTTFFEGLDKQEPLFVSNVEADSSQKVSAQIPHNLDYRLSTDGLNAVREKLATVKERLIALDVPDPGPDEAKARQWFQFAKQLNVSTIIADPPVNTLPIIDKLANEFDINVAILNQSRDKTPSYADPHDLLKAVSSLSNRVGACVDIANWMQAGIHPVDGVKVIGQRLIAVRLVDRSGLGTNARNVALGSGAANAPAIFESIYKAGVNPALISIAYTGSGGMSDDMARSFDALDKALRPIAADRVDQLSKKTPIRGPERLSEADRAAVIAAVPSAASAQPKKPRRLLVVDLNIAYPGHLSIPAANLALRLWGEKTGAYTAIFDNNLDNLKYPAIKQYDAVFLNNTVGQVFPDPAVREGLMRFIREGGGLGAYHGTPHASMDWTEFGDMLAARGGSHRDPNEKATIRIEDPQSPITAVFEGKEFEWQDEFFRFTTPPWSRDKVHVLLSFDTEKTDLHQKPDCEICNRADNDYPVSWIRSYGKGRIFYATIGHRPALFEDPVMARFVLAGVQFILGDLDADTTPGVWHTAASPSRGVR